MIIPLIVDGGWSAWMSAGSKCSVPCGHGSKIRIRSCNNPVPENGGRDCPGQTFESSFCMLKECPGKNWNPKSVWIWNQKLWLMRWHLWNFHSFCYSKWWVDALDTIFNMHGNMWRWVPDVYKNMHKSGTKGWRFTMPWGEQGHSKMSWSSFMSGYDVTFNSVISND